MKPASFVVPSLAPSFGTTTPLTSTGPPAFSATPSPAPGFGTPGFGTPAFTGARAPQPVFGTPSFGSPSSLSFGAPTPFGAMASPAGGLQRSEHELFSPVYNFY